MSHARRNLLVLFCTGLVLVAGIALVTFLELRVLPPLELSAQAAANRAAIFDKRGASLASTYENHWNTENVIPFHEFPPLLTKAFVTAEDKRFYQHHGVDWRARISAVRQAIANFRVVRGASTITEQVVRMVRPRPRTLWSRWLEGWEARNLEKNYSKAEILDFYLNQVPFARKRRGVAQAALLYFDRSLDTLSPEEMVALAVLIRAPSRLDLMRDPNAVKAPAVTLAKRLFTDGTFTSAEVSRIENASFQLADNSAVVPAEHFVSYVRKAVTLPASRIVTTLESNLQERATRILERRVKDLAPRGVSDGALLVVDHRTGEVRAWVNAGRAGNDEASHIDAVLTPRQPGSTLKPFLYELAMEEGWTSATIIDDAPLSEPVGVGMHRFRNYSRVFYGPIRLRDALGNSLNIPAVKAVMFTSKDSFLNRLRDIGFRSLAQGANFYGDGLALGNGEVSLFELTQAYVALARGGSFVPLKTVTVPAQKINAPIQVMNRDISYLIGDILSDPEARRREFGGGNLLRFPIEVAVKTGTSSDFRDAWAVGYSSRYVVGVWMGNLSRAAMADVSGSIGPALVLRSVFSDLNRDDTTLPLKRGRNVAPATICSGTGLLASPDCPAMKEWFYAGTKPKEVCDHSHVHTRTSPVVSARIITPSPGLRLARDPRIPDSMEAFPFTVAGIDARTRVTWMVDGERVGTGKQPDGRYMWPVNVGDHIVSAQLEGSGSLKELGPVKIYVR